MKKLEGRQKIEKKKGEDGASKMVRCWMLCGLAEPSRNA